MSWSVLFVPTLLCLVHRKSFRSQSPRKRLISVHYFHLHCCIVTDRSTLCSNFSVLLQRLFNSMRIPNSCQIFLVFIFCSVHFFQFSYFESHCSKVLEEQNYIEKTLCECCLIAKSLKILYFTRSRNVFQSIK